MQIYHLQKIKKNNLVILKSKEGAPWYMSVNTDDKRAVVRNGSTQCTDSSI
jgi:hypothetical protein